MEALGAYPLAVDIKMKLSRFLSWLSFLLPDKYFLMNYHGGKIYLNLKESPMMWSRALGVYEYWKTKLFLDLVKEGMTIVDIGVNKGYFSLLSARLMNDTGRVLSFEPDPDNCFWIRKSIQANNYRCIELSDYALSDREGKATFYRGAKSGWGSLFFSPSVAAPDEEPITVRTRTLDNVLDEKNVNHVDIVKIDVQGADLLVLRGAENTLRESEDVKLIMDVDVGTEEERNQLLEFLSSCGLETYVISRELERIERIDETVKDIFAKKVE